LLRIPTSQSFEERPEFAFFADLSEAELCAAERILARRYASLAFKQDFSIAALLAQRMGEPIVSNDN